MICRQSFFHAALLDGSHPSVAWLPKKDVCTIVVDGCSHSGDDDNDNDNDDEGDDDDDDDDDDNGDDDDDDDDAYVK